MTERRLNTFCALAFSIALFGTPKLAQAGFCGNYIQTASNAGNCNNCRLTIADNPEIQKYFVTANNGWEAELTWTHGEDTTATGSGNWNNGQRFDIDLNQQGRRLDLVMSNPGSGPIRATFKCLDAKVSPKNCVARDRNGAPFRVPCTN